MQVDTYPSILPNGAALSRKVRILAPYPRSLTCRVGKSQAGLEITDFLMKRFPYRTLAAWEERLAQGLITQGGRLLKPGDRLLPEPPLMFTCAAQVEPSVPDETVILEETGDYLLVYKPAPLPVHPGGRYNRNTLITILRERGLADTLPLLVLHRLDSVTSGLVLFGRQPAFTRAVQGALARGEAVKTYLGLVRGVPARDRMSVDSPIRRKHGYVFECHKSGKDSQTDFEVLRRFDGSALVRCRPRTGRTHQIRLHLREWGHPVIDDPVYGQPASYGTISGDSKQNDPVSDDPVSSGNAISGVPMPGVPVPGGKRIPDAHLAGTAVQNRAISLLNCRLRIEKEGLDFRLSYHVAQPENTRPVEAGPVTRSPFEHAPAEPFSGLPVPGALAGEDLRFLLD